MIQDANRDCLIRLPKGRPSKKFAVSVHEILTIENIRDELHINNDQQVLLSFAWISGSKRDMLQKFPELVVVDVTEKTNKEKRSMFMATGIDGLGKIFIAFHCYMPNAQASSYNWIYTHVMPTLWGHEIISNIQAVITDGEHALYDPLRNLTLLPDSTWNASLYRCTFHLFTQEWQ